MAKYKYGHVAQLVRALRSHRRGHWFEPSRDHQNSFIKNVHVIMNIPVTKKRSRGVVGLTCQPVTLETVGSSPIGSAI